MAKAPTWTGIKKELTGYDSSDLIAVIKSLYDLCKQNQAMPMGLVDQEASLESLKAPVIKAIAKAFNPTRGFPSFKPTEAKRAVHQFVKIAPQHESLELMLHFVQDGIWATKQYGDIDEAFYIGLENMWDDALELVLQFQEPQSELPRLKTILKGAQGFGFALFMEKLEARS